MAFICKFQTSLASLIKKSGSPIFYVGCLGVEHTLTFMLSSDTVHVAEVRRSNLERVISRRCFTLAKCYSGEALRGEVKCDRKELVPNYSPYYIMHSLRFALIS